MLDDLQTKKLTRYFRLYDVDDDGRIAAADFERVLENVKVLHGATDGSPAFRELRSTYMELWRRLSRADGDGDHGVDLEEWLAHWEGVLADDDRFEEEAVGVTDRLFAVFDTDDDGRIGASEFADFFGVFGLSMDLARTSFEALDLDGDGALTRDELLTLSREFFRATDAEASGNQLFGPVR